MDSGCNLAQKRDAVSRREIIRAGIAFLLINVLFFSQFIFCTSRMPYWIHSDTIRLSIPWKQFIQTSFLATGELPLWLPYVWSGSPCVVDVSSQLFYPPNAPFLLVRPEIYISYYMLIHVALAGFFMYCYVRATGLPTAPALLGAILYMYGGFTAHFCRFQQMAFIVCWLPALFFSLELLAQKKNAAWAILSGVIAAAYLMGVHPQIFFISGLCAVAYYILRVVVGRYAILKMLCLGCLACLAFAGLAAASILPWLETASHISRSAGIPLPQATGGSISPSTLSSFFLTGFGSGDFTCHEGPIALFLVVAALISPWRWRKSFFTATAVCSLLLAFGKYTPFYALAFRALPGMKLFRDPARFLVLFGFSIPMLAAYGLKDLMEALESPCARDRMKRSALIVLISTAGIILPIKALSSPGEGLLMRVAERVYAILNFSLPFEAHRAEVLALLHEGYAASLILLAMTGACGIIIYLLLTLRAVRTGYATGAIVALALIETWCFSLPALMSIDPSFLYRTNELVEFLEGHDGSFRVLNMGGERILPQYLAIPHRIELADGYSPTMTLAYLIYTNRIGALDQIGPFTKLPLTDLPIDRIKRPILLDLLNVRYLISEERISDARFHEVREFFNVPAYRQGEGIVCIPRVIVYENKSYLPRAFLVPDTVGCNTDEECLELLDRIDPRTTMVVYDGETSHGGSHGRIEIEHRTPNRLVIDVHAEEPTNLFLSEIWYPGWKATDNGRPTRIGRANYLFRHLPIEKGNHRIEMLYSPRAFLAGRAISLITIALIALFFMRRGKSKGRDT